MTVVCLFFILALPLRMLVSQAMVSFCRTAELHDASRSWGVTRYLFLFMELVPGTLYVGMAAVSVWLDPVSLGPYYTDWNTLILKLVASVPLLHFYVSISRMKREALRDLLPD